MTPKFDNMVNETFSSLIEENPLLAIGGTRGLGRIAGHIKNYNDPGRTVLNPIERLLSTKPVARVVDTGTKYSPLATGAEKRMAGANLQGAANAAKVKADFAAKKLAGPGLFDPLTKAWGGLSPAGKIAAGLGAAGVGYLGYKGLTSKDENETRGEPRRAAKPSTYGTQNIPVHLR